MEELGASEAHKTEILDYDASIFFESSATDYLWPLLVFSFWGPDSFISKNQMKSFKPIHF